MVFHLKGYGCGCRFKSNCPIVGPMTRGGMPSRGGVFPRDPNPYLREFRSEPQKTPNGKVVKRDQEPNSAPLVYQFWAQNRSATGGLSLKGNN